jgi:type I restriction enzyme, S subunit
MKQGSTLSLPKGWEIKRLGEVCETGAGGTPLKTHKDYYEGGTIPWLLSGEVSQGEIFEAKNFITEKGLRNSSAKLFPPNTVLVAMYGATAGQVGILRFEATTNQAVCGILPNDKTIPEYLFYCFLEKKHELVAQAVGGAQPNISQIKIKKTKIPLPPLPEQQRIVSILDKAFAAIERSRNNAEQNLKNAKELLEVFLHKYFTNKEEGWEEKRLKDVAEYFNGLTYSPKDVSYKGMIVLRSSNIQNDKLDFSDIVRVNVSVKDKIIVKDGDILMCSRNGSKRLVGKTAPIENLPEQMTFGTFMMIVRSNYNPYLLWFFKSLDFKKQISGGENTMINQITRYMLDDIVVTFPPLEKQMEIVKQLDAIYNESQKLESIYLKKIDDLEELKKSILQKAFKGEL